MDNSATLEFDASDYENEGAADFQMIDTELMVHNNEVSVSILYFSFIKIPQKQLMQKVSTLVKLSLPYPEFITLYFCSSLLRCFLFIKRGF